MFIRLKHSARTVHPTVQIVESHREEGKVKQRVVASLGSVKDEKDLERLQTFARGMILKLQEERTRQGLLFDGDFKEPKIESLMALPLKRKPEKALTKFKISDLEHSQTIYDGFVTVVDKLFSETGFDKVPMKRNRRLAFDPMRIAKILVAQRFFAPASKLRTYQRQGDIGVDGVKLHQFYRGLDLILRAEESLQRRAFAVASAREPSVFKEEIECLFIDVTTLYFESVNTDELRNFGYSKDQKFHSVQVVLCLVVNAEGIPIAYEVFSGNTAEVSTVVPVIDRLKSRFDVKKITVVCDRGLASRGNIEKLQSLGIGHIAACKIKHLPSFLRLNDLSTYDCVEHDKENKSYIRRLPHPNYPNSELIVTWNQSRALKDKGDREKLLRKLAGKLGQETASTKLKKIVTNSGYRQLVKIGGSGKWEINLDAVAKTASWDGFHAIAVSNNRDLTTEAALMQYKNLWRVEEAFRVSKTQLEIRPMFHWTPNRIRAHVLICFVSLFLERFLEKKLRDAGQPLTPDRIRYAIQRVHAIHFQDSKTGRCGVMESSLSKDAQSIFSALSIPTRRSTRLIEN